MAQFRQFGSSKLKNSTVSNWQMKPAYSLLCAAVLACTACSTAPKTTKNNTTNDLPIAAVAEIRAAQQVLAPETLPKAKPRDKNSLASFEAETLFDLIMAEMAVKENRLDITLGNYLKQAHRTQDPNIIARTTRIANFLNAHQATRNASELWLSVDPGNVEALQTIVVQELRNHEFESAIDKIDILLGENENSNFDFFIHHTKPLEKKRRQEVIDLFSGLIEKHPGNAQLWLTKALLEQQNQNIEKAIHDTDKSLRYDKQYVSAVILKSQLLSQEGNNSEALKLLKKAAKKSPEHKRLGIVYAKLLLENDRMESAQTQFSNLVKRFPDDNDLVLSMALISWENKIYDTAEHYLQRLVNNGYKPDEMQVYLAQLSLTKDNTKFSNPKAAAEKAINHYQQVATPSSDSMSKANPNNGSELYMKSQLHIAQLRAEHISLELAAAGLDNAAQIISKNSSPTSRQQALALRVAKAELYWKHGDTINANLAYEHLLQLTSNAAEKISILYSRAMAAEKADNFTQMEADLRAILTLKPDSALALNALGYTLAERTERLSEAQTLIEKAIALKPNDPAIIDSLGWVYFRQGDLDNALKYLSKAYKLLPDPEIAAHLGEVLWLKGEQEKAKQIWQNALKTDKEGPVKMVMDKYLPQPQ